MTRSFKQFAQKIRDINQRYNEPHIEMSTAVRWSLMVLRVYLLFLVSLMIYKFITLLK
ncbi:MAG: hypothetical protein HQL77_15130 [Magnetococcales bacterium]|nr:hypothetical protein [Magnetococcales bacterium]MBF0436693.1 hypothetical protein [Magnetococcales bacterium]